MFSFSTIWRSDTAGEETYYIPFWSKNLFHFEAMENIKVDTSLLKPLKVSNVAMWYPQNLQDRLPSLASENEEEREKAIHRLLEACKKAEKMKTPYLVIWPGKIPLLEKLAKDFSIPQKEDIALRKEKSCAYLDRLCRSLYEVGKKYPDMIYCIPPARWLDQIPLWEEMEWILSDLNHLQVKYWHNTASSHSLQKLGISEQEAWLDKYGPYMAGIHLEDVVGYEPLYPPGLGEVDFRNIKKALPEKNIRVLRVGSNFGLEEIWFCCDYLREIGLLE